MYLTRLLALALCSLSVTAASAQQNSCSIMKSGKFRYLDAEDSTAYIVISGNKHTERSLQNEYVIESDLKWTDSCTYVMKMTRVTVPGLPFKPGDKMKVAITRVEGDIVYYDATVKGYTVRDRRFIRIE